MWFRVQLAEDGAITDVRAVEQCREERQFVRYIEAPTKAQACAQAQRWWDAWREKQIQIQRERERENAARREEREAASEAMAKKRALVEEKTRAAVEKAAGVTADMRLDEYTLRRALHYFDQNPKTFRNWITRQLKAQDVAKKARARAQEAVWGDGS